MKRIALAGTRLVNVLASFPVGLHHLDVFSRNATRVGERFVLNDWAFTGLARLGCHAASGIAVTALHGDVPGGRLGEFTTRWSTDTVVAFGPSDWSWPRVICESRSTSLTLRFARSLKQIHSAGDRAVPVIAAAIGRPFTELMKSWRSLARHLARSTKRALAGVDG